MSRTAIWVLAIACVAILAGGAYLVIVRQEAEPAAPSEPENPFGGTEPPPTGASVSTSGGGTVGVKDFMNDGSARLLPGSTSIYVLAGEYGYCAPGMECEVIESADYSIRYDKSVDSFLVGLAKEPLGETRRKAESSLMAKLGLAQNDMCKLNYYVGTTYWVNDAYADRNLGFSFCPGATQLP